MAFAETLGVNVTYWLVNRALPAENHLDYHVSPATWRANLTAGFCWDWDPFFINQVGHPYQGNNYFTAGRSLGLTYWKAMPLTALGSVTWEMFGERTQPAWNDLLNSTLGGAAIGEAAGRVSALIRSPGGAGVRGRLRNIAAMVVDPMGGLNDWMALAPAGQSASRPQPPVAGEIALGSVWRNSFGASRFGRAVMYGTVALDYGRLEDGPAREPFDAFTAVVRVGGGAGIAEASINGRLAGRRVGRRAEGAHQLVLIQAYDYQDNPALLSGAQTVLGGMVDRFVLSSTTTLSTTALAGGVILQALGPPGVGSKDIVYDYGSGIALSAGAALTWRGHRLAQVSASRRYLHTFTNSPANHVIARYSAAGRIPLSRPLRLVVEGSRVSHLATSGVSPVPTGSYSEVRAGLAWAFGR